MIGDLLIGGVSSWSLFGMGRLDEHEKHGYSAPHKTEIFQNAHRYQDTDAHVNTLVVYRRNSSESVSVRWLDGTKIKQPLIKLY